jgi:ribonuclease D
MASRPPDVNPELVKEDLTAAQLEGYLASSAVAVDTETLGLHVPRDRLCLVQLCDRAGRATLVQITLEQLQPARPLESRAPRLKQLMEAPQVLKVFHFARFDVAALLHYLGMRVAPLYCTRTASKLARTYTDRHGLKDIALELLDVEMDKAARHTDWSSPDLKPEQVRYAISDVTLLLALMDRLETMLVREGRAELAHECFRVIPVFSRLDILGYTALFEH